MRAGRLRHRITFQQEPSRTDDEIGGYVPEWSDVCAVYASVDPLRGKEALAAAQVQADTMHKITIRWRSGLTAAMRIKFGTRYFNIRELRVVREVHHIIEIIADEGVAQ